MHKQNGLLDFTMMGYNSNPEQPLTDAKYIAKGPKGAR